MNITKEADGSFTITLVPKHAKEKREVNISLAEMQEIVARGYSSCLMPFGITRALYDIQAQYNWQVSLEIVCFYEGRIVLCPTGKNHAFYPEKLTVPGKYFSAGKNKTSPSELAEDIFEKYKFKKIYPVDFSAAMAFPNMKMLPGPTIHTVVSCYVDEVPRNAITVSYSDVIDGKAENLLGFHKEIIRLGVLHRQLVSVKNLM